MNTHATNLGNDLNRNKHTNETSHHGKGVSFNPAGTTQNMTTSDYNTLSNPTSNTQNTGYNPNTTSTNTQDIGYQPNLTSTNAQSTGNKPITTSTNTIDGFGSNTLSNTNQNQVKAAPGVTQPPLTNEYPGVLPKTNATATTGTGTGTGLHTGHGNPVKDEVLASTMGRVPAHDTTIGGDHVHGHHKEHHGDLGHSKHHDGISHKDKDLYNNPHTTSTTSGYKQAVPGEGLNASKIPASTAGTHQNKPIETTGPVDSYTNTTTTGTDTLNQSTAHKTHPTHHNPMSTTGTNTHQTTGHHTNPLTGTGTNTHNTTTGHHSHTNPLTGTGTGTGTNTHTNPLTGAGTNTHNQTTGHHAHPNPMHSGPTVHGTDPVHGGDHQTKPSKVGGYVDKMMGNVKETVGKAFNNPNMVEKGTLEKAKGEEKVHLADVQKKVNH